MLQPKEFRRRFSLTLTVAVALGGTACAEAPAENVPAAKYEPSDAYADETIEGWPIRLNKSFSKREPQMCAETLGLLRQQLYLIVRNVPAPAVEKLRQIRIWIEEAEPHHPCMCYHPDPDWLRSHDMNPDKARSVELANARNFLTWCRAQPWMVFHELAHGYHHQFLDGGFENDEVRAAYERVKSAKSYDSVLRIQGRHDRHYALTNPQEYFAESSEAYFGTNDFYPFVRSELREADKEGFELLERLWLVASAPRS